MNNLSQARTELRHLTEEQILLFNQCNQDTKPLQSIITELDSGELSIAVVGEIKRGKSTFLNALLGAKVFPSRATICTASVTILDQGAEPRAQVFYRNRKPETIDLSGDEPIKALEKVVSRANPNVQDINMVRIWYPNPFTGNGIVLVDTPGVNDPDMWREEITYQYLATADAVIMLLDPMQPLSASETEFLSSKILGQTIASLFFVVNRIDDVSYSERQSAMKRIEEMLSKYVPNPILFAVSSKSALQAKLTGDEPLLKTSGFPTLETALLNFLEKGRGGFLLKTKVHRALAQLDEFESTTMHRMSALDMEKGEVEKCFNEASKELEKITSDKKELEKNIRSQEKDIARSLNSVVDDRIRYLRDSLKPQLISEPDVETLRRQILTFQKDSIEILRLAIKTKYESIMQEYSLEGIRLHNDIGGIFDSLHRSTESISSEIVVQRREGVSYGPNYRTAGAVGAITGAVGGTMIASSIATTAVATTATGAIIAGSVTALGIAGIIGAGILTGGIGLLLGLAVANYLSDGKKTESSGYVQARDIVDNKQAFVAVERFINNLKSVTDKMAQSLISAVIIEVVDPLQGQIDRKREEMEQIKSDLRRTEDGQRDLRKELNERILQITNLRNKWMNSFGEFMK
jgi:GTP-binding protein EngB required for normal cell division